MSHVTTLLYGVLAGLASVAVFSVAGLLLLPKRWADRAGTGTAMVGLAVYLAGCWTAMTQRDLRLFYVIPLFAALVLALALFRSRWSGGAGITPRLLSRTAMTHAATLALFYGLMYVLVVPAGGDAFLPLAPARNIELVTHARYARHALEVGTPDDLHLAPFGYRRSPAASFLIAAHSMFFRGDPLSAALPALLAAAAGLGLVAVDLLRRCGASTRVSVAITAIILAGPVVRWVVAGFGLPEILFAAALLVLIGSAISEVAAMAAAAVLMVLAEPVSAAWIAQTLRATGRVLIEASPLALLGWPGRLSQMRTVPLMEAAPLLLPLMLVPWGAAAFLIRRSAVGDRLITSATDRVLTRALVSYVLVALVIGNVVVNAVRDPASQRVPAAWRSMEQAHALPVRGLALKMEDAPDSLSTALVLYFLTGKRTTLIGAGGADDQLRYDAISRQTPVFVQHLGCESVGHEDVISAGAIGCVLLAPPSPVLGRKYPFTGRYLFLSYDGLSPRLHDGRINTRPTLPLRVTADPERDRLDRPLFLNVKVNTLIVRGVEPQRLVFRWGEQRGDAIVDAVAWLSVPLGVAHWSGNRLWTATVNIDFPQGRPVQFEEISLSDKPEGRVIGTGAP